ncbi:MAG: hypothetical protein KF779_13700 [Hyphomonadaceae bacterium]|nr:hypothetical protein [Hyphomonadaceae bacterium]
MRRGLSLFVLAIVSAAGIAAAQTARLTAEEARRELFGVELAGVNEVVGDEWRECIEPSGRTVYRRGGRVLEGRLVVQPDGQACFNYPPDSDWSCFGVVREGENYRFDSFVTRTVRRDVRACGAANDTLVRLGAES